MKKTLNWFMIFFGFLFIVSAIKALIVNDELRDYELFFGWKTSKNWFVVIKLLIGLMIIIPSLVSKKKSIDK